jgi:hypothetical protein
MRAVRRVHASKAMRKHAQRGTQGASMANKGATHACCKVRRAVLQGAQGLSARAPAALCKHKQQAFLRKRNKRVLPAAAETCAVHLSPLQRLFNDCVPD